MRAFIVKLENRPGTLADLGEALGERGINISGLSGTSWDGDGALAVITNDDAAARRLAERGVNIELIMTTGVQGTRITVAFGVDDPVGAREALGELAATGSQPI